VLNDLRREFEQLDLFSGFGVDTDCPPAEPIGYGQRGSWVHAGYANPKDAS
jgi:hypothetical protein